MAFRLKLPIQHPPVLRRKSWVEVLIPLQQVIRTIGNFVLRPESDLDMLGKVPGIRSPQPGPSSQHPTCMSDYRRGLD
jgi:hypothetical protein